MDFGQHVACVQKVERASHLFFSLLLSLLLSRSLTLSLSNSLSLSLYLLVSFSLSSLVILFSSSLLCVRMEAFFWRPCQGHCVGQCVCVTRNRWTVQRLRIHRENETQDFIVGALNDIGISSTHRMKMHYPLCVRNKRTSCSLVLKNGSPPKVDRPTVLLRGDSNVWWCGTEVT